MPKNFTRIYFLAFGTLDLIALVVAFIYSLKVIDIYFSYFTVLSNILATFVFLIYGFGFKSKLVNRLYGPSVLYMSITGVVFWTILRNHHLVASVPWITIVMHGVMPIVVFLSWVFSSTKLKLVYKDAFIWQVFPLFFVVYTLIRGPFVHWYPYFFLNPGRVGGYLGVSKYVIFILVGSYLLSLALIWIRNSKKKFF